MIDRVREICAACGQPNPIGYKVPDEIWRAVIPKRHRFSWRALTRNHEGDGSDTFCIMCFARYADDAGVRWDRDIEFFPWSLVSWRKLLAEGNLLADKEDNE